MLWSTLLQVINLIFAIIRPTKDDCSNMTNHPPRSSLLFDTLSAGNEMRDIMCNIRHYSSPTGPQPYEWWQVLRHGVNPIFGNFWVGCGDGGAFVGCTKSTG